MTFGSGSARFEPLYWVITTAGDDPDKKSIGWEIHEKACKIRDGELSYPDWYVRIYGAPEDADIYNEQIWHDCNPNLGISVTVETLRSEAQDARNSESAERLFRWLRLNQWIAVKRVSWLPITLWDKTNGKWDVNDMLGEECYIGIDLGSTTDLTGAAPLFPPNPGKYDDWRFIVEGWVPVDNMKERIARDHVPYDSWVKNKELWATPGDRVDYGFLKSRFEQFEAMFNVKHYCGDPGTSIYCGSSWATR
jgi:phage terminase large subunit-like protein